MRRLFIPLTAMSCGGCCRSMGRTWRIWWGPAETIVISEPSRVQDVGLRDHEYCGFNFGASPFIEVGTHMGSEAVDHHAVSLIRCDLAGMGIKDIAGVKLRIYKVNSFTQL